MLYSVHTQDYSCPPSKRCKVLKRSDVIYAADNVSIRPDVKYMDDNPSILVTTFTFVSVIVDVVVLKFKDKSSLTCLSRRLAELGS